MLELRHLRYFLAVAETLHFGRAAERLGLSQPPLSVQIRQLEELVGTPLFERDRRSVRLTPAGAVFREEARRTLRQADAAVEAARAAATGESGTLRIGFVSSAPFNALPGILRRYREAHPHIGLELREMGTAVQLKALQAGEIDLGLLRLPAQARGVQVELLLREPLVAVLPDSHPLAGSQRVRIQDLRDDPFVLFPRRLGPGLYDRILSFCNEAGYHPEIVQEVEQMHALVGLVAAGLGVTLAPASMRFMRTGEAVFLELQDAPCVELGLAWARDDALVRGFRHVAKAPSP